MAKADVVPPVADRAEAQRALLEERLQRARQAAALARESRPVIPRRVSNDNLPLSSAQERLWFLDQLEPGSPVYNVCHAVRLRGTLQVEALQQALNEIMLRHEILRTNFVEREGAAVQIIAEHRTLPLAILDLSGSPEQRDEASLSHRLEEEARRSFDLARDVLVRALLVRLAGSEHVLLVTMHHIISDGWSVGILLRELSSIYSSVLAGSAPTLPELPVQFADYVLWERQHSQSTAVEKPLAYWRSRLGGTLPVLELPFDRPRSARSSSRGGLKIVQFPRELSQSLKALGQQQGATLFMTLLAAFEVLLYRCTGQRDLLVGSVVAGRQKVELERLIGFFVNTLVFRGDLSGEPTFLELLARTREVALGAFAHQDLPFERLVKELRPDRSINRNPLFQVMFVLQNAPMTPGDLPGLVAEPIDIGTRTAKFDLTLIMIESPQGLRAGLEYNADLFEEPTIARLLGAFETLLNGIVAAPERSIDELPLLTTQERRALLRDWNQTWSDFPRETPVHVVIEQQVERAPEAIALVHGNLSWTYRELNARANQLARRLRQLGVGPDSLVALCLDRSPEMIVALVGILKAGGAYVSLDPSYPAERLAYMLKDSQASVVLTTAALERVVRSNSAEGAGPAPHVLRLDRDQEGIAQEDTGNLPPNVTSRHLAYVSYTSGSTGRPKGVCIEHRSISRLVLNTNYLQLSPADAVAQLSNCAFDASTWEVWGALLNGARLVIIPPSVVLSPREFAAEVAAKGITALLLTTALFNQMALTWPEFFRPLRAVLFGGEAASAPALRALLRHRFPVRLINAYGPTEATTMVTWYEVNEVDDEASSVPIGGPVANTSLYVLDERRNPVPIGVPGELYAGGDGVARGYLRRPDLTTERFVPNPFNEEGRATNDRLYRTGDRVRWRADGTLEYLGRCDQQVKIRGFRIEPGEIEQVVQRHPGIKQAAVLVRTTESGERQLVSYVAPMLSRDDVRTFLQARLPEYMVPVSYVFLEALPINANGKVDRAALPAFEQVSRPASRAPRDEAERKLVEIWRSVLGVPEVGVQDGFFDLGGHSLLAIRMVAEIEKTFDRKLPVAAVFQHGTIERLAPLLRDERDEFAPRTSIVTVQGQGTRPPIYLVHGVGGGMFWGYSNLSRHLGNQQPVCVFNSRGLEGAPEPETIEELAASYVADLRAQQPTGPYRIGGYCFGGVVAYEMARQLKSAGEDVALLALINCSPPNTGYLRVPNRRTWSWRLKFARNIAFWLGCFLFRWPWREKKEFVRWKLRLVRKRTRTGQQSPTTFALADIDEMVNVSTYSDERRRLWQAHVKALRNYQPQPYEGRVALFRSRGHPIMCSFDEHYGWGELIPTGLRQWLVPGGHGNILDEPHVAAVARDLARELAQLDARPAKSPQAVPTCDDAVSDAAFAPVKEVA